MLTTRQTILFSLAVLLGVYQAAQLVFSRSRAVAFKNDPPTALASSSQPSSTTAVSRSGTDTPYGGILPHNLAVRGEIESYLKQFQGQNIESIVLLAPNHLAYGPNLVSTADEALSLNGRSVTVDSEIKERLLASGRVKLDDKSVADELAVKALVPLLQKYFPAARITPIIFKDRPSDELSTKLAQVLAGLRPYKRLLVLGTVDFSHYQSRPVADFHDDQSRAAIENFDYRKVKNLEIDSPAVLLASLAYFEAVGARQSQLIAHSNTADLTGNDDTPTTSHFFYAFRSGGAQIYKQASALLFGDLMLDRGVRQIIERKGADYLLADLKGEEGRFFRGSDYVGANLEGVVTQGGAHYPPALANDFAFKPEHVAAFKKYGFNVFNLANNHISDQSQAGEKSTRQSLAAEQLNYSGCRDRQVADCSSYITAKGSTTVAWLGFSQVYGQLDDKQVAAMIREAKKRADFVIVNVHWGQEYQPRFNSKQQTLAHLMIEAGADAVIGHHPHVVQGIELYQGHPIFYSLGNFIFDQYFSAQTMQGLGIGLNLTAKQVKAYLFPLDLGRSRPKLLAGKARQRRLAEIAAVSAGDTAFKQQVRSGRLVISQAGK